MFDALIRKLLGVEVDLDPQTCSTIPMLATASKHSPVSWR
jgi:hypothetical protein